MRNIYIFILFAIFLQSCEDCKIIEDTPTPTSCEGVFYSSRFIPETPSNLRSFYFDTFNQPLSNPYNSSQIEQQTVFDTDEAFSFNFSAYDQLNDTYAFFYSWDDDSQENTLYLADTKNNSSQSLFVQQDYAAPVFLNGQLYAINARQENGTNYIFEILQINQSDGFGAVVHTNTATTNGLFSNIFMSSATNNIDTIYFLTLKTIVAYNVISGTSQVFDIDIQFDADIQTALSGLEYRTATDQLIAIHHRFNSPTDINEVISINPQNGNYESLFDLGNNIGLNQSASEPIELIINSTTYSSCNDTYYITEITNSLTEPIENDVLAIDLTNLNLTKRVTSNFLFGIALDETP